MSLHNDLDTWASKARVRGNDRIEVMNETAHDIAKQLRRLTIVEDALNTVMTGGNHIASQLIGRIGAGFSTELPPDTSAEKALHRLGATVEYDMWCAWASMMRARDHVEQHTA